MASDSTHTVLLIDDEPAHLKLYSWIVEKGGFRVLTVLASPDGVSLPSSEPVEVVALDYRLGPKLKASDLAQTLKNTYAGASILVLSDVAWMPDDMKPFASAFVRKGDPDELLKALDRLVG